MKEKWWTKYINLDRCQNPEELAIHEEILTIELQCKVNPTLKPLANFDIKLGIIPSAFLRLSQLISIYAFSKGLCKKSMDNSLVGICLLGPSLSSLFLRLKFGSFNMQSTASQRTFFSSLRTTQHLYVVPWKIIWSAQTSLMHNFKGHFHIINTRSCEMGARPIFGFLTYCTHTESGQEKTLWGLRRGGLETGKSCCHCTRGGCLRPAVAMALKNASTSMEYTRIIDSFIYSTKIYWVCTCCQTLRIQHVYNR